MVAPVIEPVVVQAATVSAPAANQPEPIRQAAPPVTISRDEYDSLKRDSRMLEALRSAGVDNWEGYDDALDMLEADAA